MRGSNPAQGLKQFRSESLRYSCPVALDQGKVLFLHSIKTVVKLELGEPHFVSLGIICIHNPNKLSKFCGLEDVMSGDGASGT